MSKLKHSRATSFSFSTSARFVLSGRRIILFAFACSSAFTLTLSTILTSFAGVLCIYCVSVSVSLYHCISLYLIFEDALTVTGRLRFLRMSGCIHVRYCVPYRLRSCWCKREHWHWARTVHGHGRHGANESNEARSQLIPANGRASFGRTSLVRRTHTACATAC